MVSKDIFNYLKSYGFRFKMYDEDGNGPILDFELAEYIYATKDDYSLMIVIEHSSSREYKNLYLYKTPRIKKNTFRKILHHIKEIGAAYGYSTTVKSFNREITPKDFSILPKTKKKEEELNESVSSVSIPDDIIEKIFDNHYVKEGKKLPTRFTIWRGVSDESGSGMASYGTGLYTTTNKKMAARYGKVIRMDMDALPDFPLRFDTINDFEIWMGQTIDILGYDDKRDFSSDYPDLRHFIKKLGYDGIQIGKGDDIFFVKYPKNATNESFEYKGKKKTSYLMKEKAKVVVKHNESNSEIKKNIKEVYVVSKTGEKRKIPNGYLSLGKAVANHVNAGGNLYDKSVNDLFHMTDVISEVKHMKIDELLSECDDYKKESVKDFIKEARKQINRYIGSLARSKSKIKECGYYNKPERTYSQEFFGHLTNDNQELVDKLSNISLFITFIKK
jgi:hypothetical protein